MTGKEANIKFSKSYLRQFSKLNPGAGTSFAKSVIILF